MTTKAKATAATATTATTATTAKPKFAPSAVSSAVQKQLTLATEIATLGANGININQQMDEKCQAIRKMRKGNPVGTVKNGCAVVIAFRDAQISLGLAQNTVANNVVTFRKAINENKPYDVNAKRKEKKGAQTKGTKSSKSKEAVAVVKITIVKDAKIEDVSKGFREAINQPAFKDAYAPLYAMLIDALNDFDGE